MKILIEGFYFGTNANAHTNNTKYSVGTGGTGNFSRNMDSQVNQYNVTYYAWAYACNSAGEAVGSRVQATTPYPPFSPSNTQTQFQCFYGSGASHGIQKGYVNPYTSQISITSTSTATQFLSANNYPGLNAFARNAQNYVNHFANVYPGSAYSFVTSCTRAAYFNCCRFGSPSVTGSPGFTSSFQNDTAMRGTVFYPGVNVQGNLRHRYNAKAGPTQ